MITNISQWTDRLVKHNGIFSSGDVSTISYPEKGNEICFQVEDNSFWFRHRNDCIVEAVRKYCPNNLFFDIGGGNGFVAKGLEDNGISTVLVEPGYSGCVNAKKRGLQNIVNATLDNAGFKDNSVPAAGLFDVVEHIEKDASFLNSVHSILETKGFIFITVPAYHFLWSQEDTDAGHYRRYTLKQLENTLTGIGFTIKYSTYIFSLLPVPIFFSRTLPGKLGIKRKASKQVQSNNDHVAKSRFVNNMLERIWKYELYKIKRGKQLSFGGSCLVVAQKL